DLKMKLKKGLDGKNLPLPFSPLYNIFREEFLVFKKIFWDLINKEFIWANNSVIRIPILFVRKSGGGFYFYYNY
ncbi:hypothetical protein NEUTE2DRAFT_52082, partial [Neurospora tetrasperma FGSC 2509]